jgi:hypothetical protein
MRTPIEFRTVALRKRSKERAPPKRGLGLSWKEFRWQAQALVPSPHNKKTIRRKHSPEGPRDPAVGSTPAGVFHEKVGCGLRGGAPLAASGDRNPSPRRASLKGAAAACSKGLLAASLPIVVDRIA